MAKDPRPLSPHLQVYRWQLTMTLSILHRLTGMGLAFGAALLTWWLIAALQGSAAFKTFHDFTSSIIGQLMLLGWVWAFAFHFLNGIRHLVWDTGRWLTLKGAYASGYTVAALSLLATVAIWYAATGALPFCQTGAL